MSVRCITTAKTTQDRCKRRTRLANSCWQHGRLVKKLRIGHSAIHGLGLFSDKKGRRDSPFAFNKDEVIDEYRGKRYNKAQFDRKYPGDTRAVYAVKIKNNLYIDAPKKTDCFARFANCTHRRKELANARLGRNQEWTKMFLRAKTNIPWNKEILTSYGPDYW